MSADRWRRVERLFYDAEGLDRQARADFLARACEGDDALRDEVHTLLAADDRSHALMDRSALELVAALAATAPPVLPGRRLLGRYEVIDLVGFGGMGDVYRAIDHRLGRRVAIKILPPLLADDPSALERFEREARTIAAVSHANILAIFDSGVDGELHVIVTELLEGETVRRRLCRSPVPWAEAASIAAAVADGLEAAHRHGITHRDITPDNVLLTSSGEVKIVDFGIASMATPPGDDGGRPEPLAAGDVVGTPDYMSPEQRAGMEAGSTRLFHW